MECVGIVDACIALSILQNNEVKELNQILEAAVQMLSKMCLLVAGYHAPSGAGNVVVDVDVVVDGVMKSSIKVCGEHGASKL